MKKEELQKEISLKDKARFFALYWGQEVMMEVGKRGLNRYDVGYLDEEREDQYLELKPLSQISNEDAIEVCKLCGLVNATIRESTEDRLSLYDDTYILRINYTGYIYLLKSGNLFHQMTLKCYDYLRSKGYALPWMGLSVEQLIEYGWIKLKED